MITKSDGTLKQELSLIGQHVLAYFIEGRTI